MLEIKDSEIIKTETWQEKEAQTVLVAVSLAVHPAEAYMAIYDALGRAYDRGMEPTLALS